ncbi:hypothetical protein [Alteromonas lipolytica]|uniref:HNH nuclease domain-containing protein n=1 Tax=Alteromonas lipolytica TaxID=1856405 RepID=A0A1E8FHK5_9ALTE|nr:hypothetical protein [Alteromonas lipolytica]OFI35422.1 hypothetical protein BFC17_11680 [Alteromonas lipolytica]GGF76144.1 hypothetical protein GCM10011338_30370 [Alteromonas lipolytica]
MPGIKISSKLKSALPEEQRADIVDYLRAKAGNVCYLCDGPLNEASDDIEADHDEAEAENGVTDRQNLNLVHKHCNRVKRNANTVDVRPYLKFERFLDSKPSGIRYSGCTDYFQITPKESNCSIKGEFLNLETPDGHNESYRIFEETNNRGTLRYVYARIPREALFNDEEVQPRIIKKKQIWLIFFDLNRNPLYEAPGCRLSAMNGKTKVLMFDGQHKTVSNWLLGRQDIVAKIYLDLSKNAANELVNSIQAKIPKLSLSPLELIAKLKDEWKAQIDKYLELQGIENGSEKGFIAWLPQTDRSRAKSAMESAFLDNIISNDDFDFRNYVALAGRNNDFPYLITESQLKTKILKKLIWGKQLEENWEKSSELREQEARNIINVTNMFCKYAFNMKDTTPSEHEKRRMDRLTKGVAQFRAFDLFQTIVASKFNLQDRVGEAMLRADSSNEDLWTQIEKSVELFVNHPIWTADFNTSNKTKFVNEALTKNQNIRGALDDVGCNLGYLFTGQLDGNCLKD